MTDGDKMAVACVEICRGSTIGAVRSRDQSVSHYRDLLPDAADVQIRLMVAGFHRRRRSLVTEREGGVWEK
ncbi:hypothetical protein TIFTF001_024606 [Ficus carica]|uniref:Uncharacterized protein n=1 Tax=Ficus carica TaxID=3494 RepID=A0AA88B0S8_FICCA|nr:hypothetical protein TIFTF001_024606 [Ficus carica]